jgi:hypothetical protein
MELHNMETTYLLTGLPLRKAGANGLFDIQHTGEIGPAPFIERGQSLARLPGKGLRCVRCGH